MVVLVVPCCHRMIWWAYWYCMHILMRINYNNDNNNNNNTLQTHILVMTSKLNNGIAKVSQRLHTTFGDIKLGACSRSSQKRLASKYTHGYASEMMSLMWLPNVAPVAAAAVRSTVLTWRYEMRKLIEAIPGAASKNNPHQQFWRRLLGTSVHSPTLLQATSGTGTVHLFISLYPL